jgi:hypothetical protein
MSIQNSVIPSIARKKPKIFVCVPAKDMMHSHFAYCLQALVKHHATIGLETYVEFNLGTLVGNQREKLTTIALESGATHIMWLDSDMMFPFDVCEKLLAHNLPFVACNYSTRSMPFRAVAYQELYNWESYLPSDATGLVKVAGVGLGCALVSTKVFDDIYKPYYPITYTRKTDDYLGEDMNFCTKVDTEGGFPLMVDADLSKFVYHVGMTAFSSNHLPVTTG